VVRPWPELRRETLTSFKIFHVEKVRSRNPRTGGELDFFVLDTWDWVNVIALTEERRLVCIRQFRHGPRTDTLEIPGGAVDPGEDPLAAGLRELREETGYAAEGGRLLGAVNPNPAFHTNRCSTVLATGCRRVGELELDPGEDIEVCELEVPAFRDAIRRGEVDHALVLAAFLLAGLDPELGPLFGAG